MIMTIYFLYAFCMQLMVFFIAIKDVYDKHLQCSIIKLLIIESKSNIDHNRKLLHALDDGLKWVSKYINNYIHFQV